MSKVTCSSVFLRDRKGRYALAEGKKGFNKGKLNGYGGKVEEGESIAESAVRELAEEAEIGANVDDLQSLGTITFRTEQEVVGIGRPGIKEVEVHMFVVSKWVGEPQETEANGPAEWYDPKLIPYDRMHGGEPLWLPHFFAGKQFSGTIDYGEQGDVLRSEVRVEE